MAYFPRVGIELSSEANIRFLEAPMIHKRPAHIVRYENGSQSGRFSTPAPTVDFTIVARVNDADLAVLTDFFSTYGVVTPFVVAHPKLGEGNCYLKQTEHPLEPVVNGSTTWYRVEIPIIGAF